MKPLHISEINGTRILIIAVFGASFDSCILVEQYTCAVIRTVAANNINQGIVETK